MPLTRARPFGNHSSMFRMFLDAMVILAVASGVSLPPSAARAPFTQRKHTRRQKTGERPRRYGFGVSRQWRYNSSLFSSSLVNSGEAVGAGPQK
ncbi:BAQ_1a_G0010810.mRNA.1.CDS.1 [Saccharomyces cerevisiae]|nr:BAQ_1a_G0010810.mRNA.1.CDS.1 [Saccharomyces cerevisiae]CAI4518775.1 BAM_G0019820.mRNA.1.CDS.1 [Saccharomyces cerevisiae]CAI7075915.1 BAQ_1a_G0010810.mRNA.1.CDS.1 [Saccharomyces cerevisiae]CAI7136084.1 BAM_G0019820.mRNA.1.CDS.1 [Saccharomyces cerevisiae]